MALTVRPDDEVYQFDTVWLGPDEYTLPIQARYVAWGTWLACFLVTAAVLIPIGGSGPGGVVGSVLWSVALSVVASRAVMLVVDHERPLRSLPALFGAEARAALAASKHGEKSLLIRPSRVAVRDVPERARRIRDRKRRVEQHRLEQRGRRRRVPRGVTPATRVRPGTIAATRPEVLPASAYHTFQSHQPRPWVPAERSGPVWAGRVANADGTDDWDDAVPGEQTWSPGAPSTPPRRPAGSLPPMRSGEARPQPSPQARPHGRPPEVRPPEVRPADARPADARPAEGRRPAPPQPQRGAGAAAQPRPGQPDLTTDPASPPHPPDSRRPIEERILLPARKAR